MRGLSRTVRLMRDIFSLLQRCKIYFEDKTDCPGLKDDLEYFLRQLEQFIS